MSDEFILQLVVTAGTVLASGVVFVWRVAAMFSSRDLQVAEHVRTRDASIAETRQWVMENFASKSSINARLDQLKADMDRRFDKLDERFDRLAECSGVGHDD